MADTSVAPNNKSVQFGTKVGREPAGVKPAKGLRKKASKAFKRGLISEKAAKRHLGTF